MTAPSFTLNHSSLSTTGPEELRLCDQSFLLSRAAQDDSAFASKPIWVVLHGGPGSGASQSALQVFDRQDIAAIAPHQLGCATRPLMRSQVMTTSRLIADLEALRCELKIERWSVLAGSWGGYLALAYALTHPSRVERMVLRSPFIGGSGDLWRFLSQIPISTFNASGLPPLANKQLLSIWLARVRQLFQFGATVTSNAASRQLTGLWIQTETALASRCARRAWLHMNNLDDQRTQQRVVWGSLSRQARLDKAKTTMRRLPKQNELQKIQIQTRLLPQALKQNITRLKQQAANSNTRVMPEIDLLHGVYDGICSPHNSRSIQALFGKSTLHLLQAGHLGVEPHTQRAIESLLQASTA